MSPSAPDLKHIEAIHFDMDGVIIDSEPVSARIMQAAAREFGFDIPDAAIPSFKGLPGEVVYARAAREYGADRVDGPTLRATRDRLYEQVLPDIPLLPGIRSVIGEAHRKGWKTTLVTSSRRRHAETVLAVHGLTGSFDAVLGSEDVTAPKPAPQPYLTASSRVAAEPDRCLAVEDSINGVRSAHAAGCLVIGFGTDFDAGHLMREGAHATCATHHALIAWLRS